MDKIAGVIDHFLYRKDETGYSVFVLFSKGEEITCTGYCKDLSQGENIEAEGEYVEHPSYGRQFKMASYDVVMPTDADAIERYLGSGAIKGIGAALASRIVDKFGTDTMRIIEEEPERLAEIKGISEKKAMEIAQNCEEKRELRDAMIFLAGFQISNAMAVKIFDKYGMGLYTVMKENPYQLAEEINGIGFRIADEIAGKAGIRKDSEYRARCGLLYALQLAVGEGHCFLPKEDLLERAANLLEIPMENVEAQLLGMSIDKKILIRDERVYLPVYYYGELNCARMLRDIDIPTEEADYLPTQQASARYRIECLAKELGMEPDSMQIDAVYQCIQNGLFILSGGPGTGKTTTINLIIRYYESEGKDILLAAPTGRAAKRMSEATGYEAKTIHRLLELNGALSDESSRRVVFERNEANPLDAHVVIIDEMSMVDIHLFTALLKAVVPGTRLILVGDVDQLPSVGPGQVLRDLIGAKCFPTIILNKVFRQSEKSDIVVNAHKINEGKEIDMDNKSTDFFMLERNDTNVIYKHMIQLIQEKLPKYVDATPFDIQVLTPMRKGALGALTLNPILQEYLNPRDPKKAEYTQGEKLFRVGDKVMQIKNNYQLEWEVVGKFNITIDRGLGIFNGDMGIVKEIDEKRSCLVVEFDEQRRVTYSFSMLEELELCYAITIHKSQGSEYPAVILPLLSGPRMLFNRNLLYTAITRGRKCVTILGQRDVVMDMIHNESENKRFTSLAQRIKEVCGI